MLGITGGVGGAGGIGICRGFIYPQGSRDVLAGLVGRWDLRTNANDSVGANHGTLNGGMTYGTVGGKAAALLDGSDDYVSVLDDVSLDIASTITLCGWFRWSSALPKDYYMLMCKYTGTGATSSFFLFIRNDATKLGFYLEDNGGGGGYEVYGTASGVDPYDGNWHHFAGTSDGTTMRTYIDGVFANSAAAPPNGIRPTTTPLNIGRAPGGTPYHLKGAVRDCRIYNRALSAAEVVRLASIS